MISLASLLLDEIFLALGSVNNNFVNLLKVSQFVGL